MKGMTVREAAKLLGVTRQAVLRKVKLGYIRTAQENRPMLLNAKDVQKEAERRGR